MTAQADSASSAPATQPTASEIAAAFEEIVTRLRAVYSAPDCSAYTKQIEVAQRVIADYPNGCRCDEFKPQTAKQQVCPICVRFSELTSIISKQQEEAVWREKRIFDAALDCIKRLYPASSVARGAASSPERPTQDSQSPESGVRDGSGMADFIDQLHKKTTATNTKA